MKAHRLAVVMMAGLGLLAAGSMTPRLYADETCATCEHGSAATLAGDTQVPASNASAASALPEGHPPVTTGAEGKVPLPAGHPDVSTMNSAGGASQQGARALPPGHPDISTMHNHPTTQPARVGAVNIKVVQGTAGGPAITSGKVTVKLYISADQVAGTYELDLDASGTAQLRNVPLSMQMPCQPVATLIRDGVMFEGVGDVMDPYHPEQELTIRVYEVTEQKPAWSVVMRHILVEPGNGVLNVREVVRVLNPTDRAWIGQLDTDGKRRTLSLTLPEGVTDFHAIEGLDSCCMKLEPWRVTNSAMLLPGMTQYQFYYVLEPKDGTALLSLVAGVPTMRLMVMMPGGATQVSAEGLQSMVHQSEGGQQQRIFQATGLSADQRVSLTVSGIEAAAAVATAGGSAAPKIVAAVGGGLVLLVAAAFLFIKSPKKAAA